MLHYEADYLWAILIIFFYDFSMKLIEKSLNKKKLTQQKIQQGGVLEMEMPNKVLTTEGKKGGLKDFLVGVCKCAHRHFLSKP